MALECLATMSAKLKEGMKMSGVVGGVCVHLRVYTSMKFYIG